MTIQRRPLTALLAAIGTVCCAPAHAQLAPAPGQMAIQPAAADPGVPNPALVSEPATMDGCEVVARIDGQVVLACEVLWQVNRLLEQNRAQIPPNQYDQLREQLIKRHIAQLVDTKLLYHEFARNVPPENMPRIEENLLEPFERIEEPKLMKQLNCRSQHELERELSRLGSSINDARRAFNERAIASEWVRSKVKINEEIRPDEMLTFYQNHAADYEYPAQVRWEELTVRKAKYADAREAYAMMAAIGNQAWGVAADSPPGTPAFTRLVKVKPNESNATQDYGQRDWTTRGALKATAVDEALFSLPIGALSPILESDTAFHIVRVLERKDAGRKPFTEVQNDIRDSLKDERFHDAVEKYLARLRRDASIWTVYTGPVSAEVLLGRQPDGARRQ